MPNDNPKTQIIIHDWIERVKNDPHDYLERQATEVLLTSISQSEVFGQRLYLKGGILMGIVYQSSRQTADIDLTADFAPSDVIAKQLETTLNTQLRRVLAQLGYPKLICRIQTIRRQPRPDLFAEASFPALDMTIAYAERDTSEHTRLDRGQCPNILHMEISFREPVHVFEFVRLHPDSPAAIGIYSLIDVLSEKLRSLLQQPGHKRNRRPDVYDIDLLVRKVSLNSDDKREVLEALRMDTLLCGTACSLGEKAQSVPGSVRALLDRAADLRRNQRPPSVGMGGRLPSEQVAGLPRNRQSTAALEPESLVNA